MMPKRPRQHQQEDSSKAIFIQKMPKHWVVREKSHDYGIDLEVEIFDKNDNATGLLFLVQMKSTSTKRKSVDIQITTVNYGCRSAITDNSDICIVVDSFVAYWVK